MKLLIAQQAFVYAFLKDGNLAKYDLLFLENFLHDDEKKAIILKMNLIQTQIIGPHQKEAIFKLWNAEYPLALQFASQADLELYLKDLKHPSHYFIVEVDTIIGWAFVFERENENWFAVIIDAAFQSTGLGKSLLDKLKAQHASLQGWVIDHQVYLKSDGQSYVSPLPFYLKNEFSICDARLENEKLSAVKISWTELRA